MSTGVFDGLSVFVNLRAREQNDTVQLIEKYGGKTVPLAEADIAVARRGTAAVSEVDVARKACVSTTWLRRCVAESERVPYGEFLIGEFDPDAPEGVATTSGVKRTERSSDDTSAAKRPKSACGPAPWKSKKRVHIAIASDTDDSVLVPVVKRLGGTVHDVVGALSNGERLDAVVSSGFCDTTADVAYAVALGARVVSDRWVYESLEAGKWLDPSNYVSEEHAKALDNVVSQRAPPFQNLFVYAHSSLLKGRGQKITITGIVRAGGGVMADQVNAHGTNTANVMVTFEYPRYELPERLAVVTPRWLFESAARYAKQPYENYLPSGKRPRAPAEPTADADAGAAAAPAKAAKKAPAAKRGKKAVKAVSDEDEKANEGEEAAPAKTEAAKKTAGKKGKKEVVEAVEDEMLESLQAAAPAEVEPEPAPEPATGAPTAHPTPEAGPEAEPVHDGDVPMTEEGDDDDDDDDDIISEELAAPVTATDDVAMDAASDAASFFDDGVHVDDRDELWGDAVEA